MITLKSLVRMDTAIGAITTDECLLIATILDRLGRSWFLRLFLPKAIRSKDLEMRMIAATLGRTPEERQPSFQEQIRLAMIKGEAAQ